jgi:hypothetical protein
VPSPLTGVPRPWASAPTGPVLMCGHSRLCPGSHLGSCSTLDII